MDIQNQKRSKKRRMAKNLKGMKEYIEITLRKVH